MVRNGVCGGMHKEHLRIEGGREGEVCRGRGNKGRGRKRMGDKGRKKAVGMGWADDVEEGPGPRRRRVTETRSE